MPQIVVILAPRAASKIQEGGLEILERRVARATERFFGIEGRGDVAITRIEAARTLGESEVQIEVRYTVGEDEYDQGKPFDPSKEQREKLADVIIGVAEQILPEGVDVSAWIKPIRDSVFKRSVP